MITLDSVLQGMFIGIIFAVLVIGYNKLVIGKFVKALIKAEAVHPAFAKTFDELKIKKNIFISVALRKGSTLRKVVAERVDGAIMTEDIGNIVNVNNKNGSGYYYIPEDKLYRAGRIYGGKDVDLLMLAAVIIIFFIFFSLVLLYLPSLLNYGSQVFQDMIGATAGGGGK